MEETAVQPAAISPGMIASVGLQDDLVAEFRWIRGHADIWRWFADPHLFDATIKALADPFLKDGVTVVVGVESRGFLLAGAVAQQLEAGVVPIRKRGAIFPGSWSSKTTAPDYRERSIELLLQREVLSDADRVLIVDDWVETGSQMLTAIDLIEETGSSVVGVAVIVADSPSDAVRRLPRFHSIVPADKLGSAS